MNKQAFKKYFQEIKQVYLTQDYTEYSFRTSFQNFIECLNENYKLHQETRRTAELGAPDFKAFLGARKIGSIETKNLAKNLDEVLVWY